MKLSFMAHTHLMPISPLFCRFAFHLNWDMEAISSFVSFIKPMTISLHSSHSQLAISSLILLTFLLHNLRLDSMFWPENCTTAFASTFPPYQSPLYTISPFGCLISVDCNSVGAFRGKQFNPSFRVLFGRPFYPWIRHISLDSNPSLFVIFGNFCVGFLGF